jgi:hypothetical protein
MGITGWPSYRLYMDHSIIPINYFGNGSLQSFRDFLLFHTGGGVARLGSMQVAHTTGHESFAKYDTVRSQAAILRDMSSMSFNHVLLFFTKGFSVCEQYQKVVFSHSQERIYIHLQEWEAFVRTSRYSLVGFFDPDKASGERNAFIHVASTMGHVYAMALVDSHPKAWLGSAAIPDWLGIDCSHDHSTWLLAAYHTR